MSGMSEADREPQLGLPVTDLGKGTATENGVGPRRKIVILTSHVFLRGYRKASVHFVASRWAEQGHDVHFLTIGHSWLTLLKDRPRFRALSERQANRFETVAPNLRAGAHLPPLHAFSSGNRILNTANEMLFRLYGNYLPRFARSALAVADLVVVESGSALAFSIMRRGLIPRREPSISVAICSGASVLRPCCRIFRRPRSDVSIRSACPRNGSACCYQPVGASGLFHRASMRRCSTANKLPLCSRQP